MTAESTAGTPLTLNDLPMPEDRDAAWRILHDHGGLIELDNGFAAARLDIVEAVMKNPEIFSSKEASDSLGSPIPLVPIAFDPPEQTRYRRILQPFFSPRAIRPLGFGVGVHRCLGSHLARLEMRIVYEEWHRLIPDYRIADGSTPRVKWPRGTIGLESLGLVIGK